MSHAAGLRILAPLPDRWIPPAGAANAAALAVLWLARPAAGTLPG